jgi:DNA-binding IclR family transcriptional regulator
MPSTKAGEKAKQLKVAALERALSVLAVFERYPGPVSLARIADATGLYKSTILRFMESFEAHGYVQRLPDGQFKVGPTLFRLGTVFGKTQSSRDLILSTLERLVAQGTESASFHVRDGQQRLCLYRVDSRHTTLDTVKAGDHLPLERGAAGKVLLAWSGGCGKELDQVRKDGHSLSKGERDPACWALAAPVFGRDGALLGAISLSGPKERFTPASIERMTAQLRQESAECSSQAVSLSESQVRAAI